MPEKLSEHNPVIVIGAGPAGLMAATEAALSGWPTVLLEKMPSPGRKLLITGNGRCNVTNSCDPGVLPDHIFNGAKFLRSVFSRFNNRDLVALLKNSGMTLVEEPGGKLFPASGKAADILDFFLQRAKAAGVQIISGMPVEEVILAQPIVTAKSGSGVPQVTGVRTGQGLLAASAVVLAAGGRSWPRTGSNGDGTRIAAAAGHSIVPERPALVPLVLMDQQLRSLQGIALRDIELQLKTGRTIAGSTRGDLLFTHFGVSGPAVLRLSRLLSEPWPDEQVSLLIDLLPELSAEAADRQLLQMLAAEPRRQLRNSLSSWLPAAFCPHLLRLADLPAELMNGRVTKAQRQQLLRAVKALRLQVNGSRGFREAIVTAGGVKLNEINPRTMASRLVSGLFLAGEVLNIDADTGGYNLQAAWSTGWLAGRSAAEYSLQRSSGPAIII
jgi:predicted Rossmann fold flavoprotein